MEIPVNHQQSLMNLEEASFPNSSQSQYEEIKDDLPMSNKQERIHHANYDLKELLRQTKPSMKKVYSDALYKDFLRYTRRWVHNLLEPILLNVKPNQDNIKGLIDKIL